MGEQRLYVLQKKKLLVILRCFFVKTLLQFPPTAAVTATNQPTHWNSLLSLLESDVDALEASHQTAPLKQLEGARKAAGITVKQSPTPSY
jgi:hypothetical protein